MIVLFVTANKIDKYKDEKVTEKEGKEFALKIGATFAMTSALVGTGIQELFQLAAKEYIEKIVSRGIEPNDNKGMSIQNTMSEKKKKSCCD